MTTEHSCVENKSESNREVDRKSITRVMPHFGVADCACCKIPSYVYCVNDAANKPSFFVLCPRCGQRSPLHADPLITIGNWNDRQHSLEDENKLDGADYSKHVTKNKFHRSIGE